MKPTKILLAAFAPLICCGSNPIAIVLEPATESGLVATIENVSNEDVALVEIFTDPIFSIQVLEDGSDEFWRPYFMADVESPEAFEHTLNLKPGEKFRITHLKLKAPLSYDLLSGEIRVKYIYDVIQYPVWDRRSETRYLHRVESNKVVIHLHRETEAPNK